jgi:hypothetical protein
LRGQAKRSDEQQDGAEQQFSQHDGFGFPSGRRKVWLAASFVPFSVSFTVSFSILFPVSFPATARFLPNDRESGGRIGAFKAASIGARKKM